MLKAIIILFLCFFILIPFFLYLCYLDDIPSGNPILIKFNDFLTYYKLNPNRYELHFTYLLASTSGLPKTCYFNFIDTFKYKKFNRNINKNEKRLAQQKSYIEILEAVQKDIDALRNQSNQEIKEASDRAVEIAERLNKK